MKIETVLTLIMLVGSAEPTQADGVVAQPGTTTWVDIGNELKNEPLYYCFYKVIPPILQTCYDEYKVFQKGSFKYCCAVATLRTCIFNKIEEPCGALFQDSQMRPKLDQFMTELVEILSGQGEGNGNFCTGEETIYKSGSPLCWSRSGQKLFIMVVILLVVLAIAFCYLIVVKFCGSCCNKRKNSDDASSTSTSFST